MHVESPFPLLSPFPLCVCVLGGGGVGWGCWGWGGGGGCVVACGRVCVCFEIRVVLFLLLFISISCMHLQNIFSVYMPCLTIVKLDQNVVSLMFNCTPVGVSEINSLTW